MNLIVKENELGQVISARELHEFLEVKRDFTTWVKGRIEKYNFVENEDYQEVWNDTKTGDVKDYNGSSNSMVKRGYTKNYLLTLDMAKELSMIENNEKGRQARKYFIACEKKYVALLKKEKLLLQYKNLKLDFDNIDYQNYDKTLNSIKAHINNLKSRLVYEKKVIELKISELDKTGLTCSIEAYLQPDGEIAVIQNL